MKNRDERGRICRRHHHRHGNGLIYLDSFAQRSALREMAAELKLLFCFAMLLLCVGGDSPLVSIFVLLLMSVWSIRAAGISPRDYLRVMLVPEAFLVLSCATILIQITVAPPPVPSLRIFHLYCFITAASLRSAALLFLKAYGAICCIFFLSLSTPLASIIDALKRFRMPPLIIELMYLTYRFIFILMNQWQTMNMAAGSRLGFRGFRRSLSTFSLLCGHLLAGAFRRSKDYFNAMESRCYDGRIRFLTPKERFDKKDMALFLFFVGLTAGLLATLKWKGWDLF